MTFTSMYIEKGSIDRIEEFGEELAINFSRLFVFTISSKKRDRKEFTGTFKEYVWNSFTSLMKFSKKAALKMADEGMFEKVASKARDSCEGYFYIT